VVPMTTLEVVDALRKGRLTEQSLVWRIGMHDWTALLEVPQLRLAAGSVPPPAFEEAAAEVRSVPSSAVIPSSLAPMTAEAAAASSADAGSTWNRGELDELLSGERRADQRSSRRVVLGAALGSAALAALFTLLLLRSPSQHKQRSPAQTVHGSEQPAWVAPPAPTEAPKAAALPSTSASTNEPAPVAAHLGSQSVAPRNARRPKRASSLTSASSTATSVPAPDAPSAPSSVAVVPAAPLDPTPTATATASAAVESAPAPSAVAAPSAP
jgi:hypothetical protein